METLARLFDARVDSDDHARLRDSAWMGGDQVEGPYLLGMLVGENLFRMAREAYIRTLHAFVATRISALAADIFATNANAHHLMPYLRRVYAHETDLPRINGPHNDRIERAIEYLLHNLDASDSDIAAVLNTTEKQIQRISDLTAARKAIRLYRESRPS